MKKNMGNVDRMVRIILAIAFSVAYFTKAVEGTLGYVLLGLGAIFLLTSIVSFCPLYTIFGINTCKK
ncbi:MAG: DUF2892 domain-containing protein [Flavobacteriales bacterium]